LLHLRIREIRRTNKQNNTQRKITVYRPQLSLAQTVGRSSLYLVFAQYLKMRCLQLQFFFEKFLVKTKNQIPNLSLFQPLCAP
jgi:hypothetical protein